MPTEKYLSSLVINTVDNMETLDAMNEAGLINEDELYLIEQDGPFEGGSSGGDGDMKIEVYDPQNKATDIFDYTDDAVAAHNTDENAHENMGWIRATDEEAETPIPIDADTLGGHGPEYFASAESVRESVQSVQDSKVPITRKINNKQLNADITLTAADIGAATTAEVQAVQATAASKAPMYGYGTEDLVAGTSELETGKLYFVFE